MVMRQSGHSRPLRGGDVRNPAKVIDLHDWKIRAALREVEQARATAEAAQAVLAEAVMPDHTTRKFGTCMCADCMRWASDLPCSKYPACSCCGRPVRSPKIRK